MLEKADSIYARARVKYKEYSDRLVKRISTYGKGDDVFLRRQTTEAKNVQDKENNKVQ